MVGLSFLVTGKTLDIHLHDTYYIITLQVVYGVMAGILLFYGLLYRWTGNVLFSRVLTWTHILFTALLVVLVATVPFWEHAVEQGFSRDPFEAAGQRWRFHRNLSLFVLLLLAGQLLFLVNLVAGVVRRGR